MQLSDIGEFGLIEKIARQFTTFNPDVVCGIGDDCAVIKLDSKLLLVTTDLLVEKIHFLMNPILAKTLGRKSLAVNISDIAAMGGEPLYFFLSIGIPKTTSTQYLDCFFAGLHEMASEYNMLLLGGDTTGSANDLIINIAVIGQCVSDRAVYRHTAQPGDVIQVSGFLGSSSAGLAIQLEKADQSDDFPHSIRAHNDPVPKIIAGKILASFPEVTSMIDISDGLLQDLGHICQRSHVGATIHFDKIPVHVEVARAATVLNRDPKGWILNGGEDYELCWTVRPERAREVLTALRDSGNPNASEIGKITNQPTIELLNDNKLLNFANFHGWDHFKK